MSIPKHQTVQIDVELNSASLKSAMTLDAPWYLHVHPNLFDVAMDVVHAEKPEGARRGVIVIADETILITEWYITKSIGRRTP